MSEPGGDWLVGRFEENRQRLRGVAFRMLGSLTEADDAVQETWLRLSRSDPDSVENLGGWLTTVIARVCLDMLRSRSSRREELGARLPEPAASAGEGGNPETEALLADSVGLALLVVLSKLAPAERVAFVLHDMFAVPFDEVAAIVGRSPTAARQLASRARRRVQGAEAVPDGDLPKQREIVTAFLAASRDGDFQSLLELLDPDVVLSADTAVVRMGSPARLSGGDAVAGTFAGRARAARLALVDGIPGAAWAHGGDLLVVFDFTVANGKITAIEMIADPLTIGDLDVEFVRG
jgi:RNA polymerase sigma factor (sigma-70 family)